ncbi:surfactin synthase thioesterase subunit [Anaerocolumna cellulosilytica]|uniref:Surfactin synthase thioesterase subunit n=1 Tax=Anaerocolumna cellulosilytica TaxID=433286 RepID=A0A6S6R5U5_9FIRM|nr:thioesterase domain-containing protein [Anaerocolumna cellulosilytica]MBB5196470.1 external thioesterase TEII [Anaerocolumna cellulosilytica]BCJ94408.1 surfactin synthase thioesterase subunit [Anaerocolumna cellulosilytica]
MKKNEKIVLTEGDNKFAIRFFSEDKTKPIMFCFPYIGGNSNCYRKLSDKLLPYVNIAAIDPPGHGVVNGKLMQNINELVEVYYKGLQKYINGKFYIFGHSLGGIISYLLTARFEQEGQIPESVFISAATPPSRIPYEIENMPQFETDEGIKKELLALGGKYAQLVNSNSIFLFSSLRIIKADYKLVRSLDVKQSPSLHTQSYILFSHEDEVADAKFIKEWKKYCQNSEVITVTGNHNYIEENTIEIGKIVSDRIKNRNSYFIGQGD